MRIEDRKTLRRSVGRSIRRPPASRRGMTLLEIILALTLLSILFGVVFGLVGMLDGLQLRNQRSIAAKEVGHRLVLAHLDDDTAMPSKSQPIEYGRFKFMYDLHKEKVVMELNQTQRSSDVSPQGLDRFEMVTINVYDAEPAGDYFQPGELVAQLTRVYDPFAPRNPDSANRYFNDPNKLLKRVFELVNPK